MKKKKYLSLILAAMFLTSCAELENDSSSQKEDASIAETTAVTETTESVTEITESATGTAETTEPIAEKTENTAAKGCGGPRPAEVSTQYTHCYFSGEYIDLNEACLNKGLNKIASDTLREKIRSWIEDNRGAIEEKYEDYQALLEKGEIYADDDIYPYVGLWYRNGYIIVHLCIDSFVKVPGSEDRHALTTFASIRGYFDCATEKELTLSELFYDDVDYMAEFNKAFEDAVNNPSFTIDLVPAKLELKEPFSGLTEDMISFSGDSFELNYDNPYLDFGIKCLDIDGKFLAENCVLWHYREPNNEIINDDDGIITLDINY